MPAFPAYSRVYAPRAGWFGAQLVATDCEIGTGAVTIADTATTSIVCPVPGIITTYTKAEAALVALNFSVMAVGVSAGQTLTIQAFRRVNAGTPADKAMTAVTSTLAAIVPPTHWPCALPITATRSDPIFQTTDAL